MTALLFDSPPRRPLAPYLRVKRKVKRELARGRWPAGARMPSEIELTRAFGVSRMTVHRALRELSDEGLIHRVQGSGTFAAPRGRVSARLVIRDPHAEIVERGRAHRAIVHVRREEKVPASIASRFGMPTGSSAFRTLIVHEQDGEPLLAEDRYVNPLVVPDYLSTDFTKTSPTEVLLATVPHWDADYSIEARMPTAREARLLRIARDEPCLVVARRTRSGDVPVTFARLVHPGSRYQIEGAFRS
ncbi:MAG TPA: UTRA domain-containing protein [Casimicrobiaceae bacterium]|nr:UTRA domain-containing protein [Casimicrobiaceae bacterium]